MHWNAPSESHSAAHSWHHRYDSRADIWSFGCILYQIAVLSAPFESKSMLALAKKIVEGKYAPIAGYSKLVTQVSDAIPSIFFFFMPLPGVRLDLSLTTICMSFNLVCGCADAPCCRVAPLFESFPTLYGHTHRAAPLLMYRWCRGVCRSMLRLDRISTGSPG